MKEILYLAYLDLVLFFRNKESIFWACIFPIILIGIIGSSNFYNSSKIEITNNCFNKLLNDTVINLKIKDFILNGNVINKIDCHDNQFIIISNNLDSNFKQIDNILFYSKTENNYLYSIVPGLLALGLLNSSLWGIGMFLIDSRSKGILKNISVLPVNKIQYFLSLLLSKFITGIFEFLLTYSFSYYFFGFKLKSSLLSIFIILITSILCFGSIGLSLGSRIKSYNYGNGIINMITFPIMLTSGVFFNIEYLPSLIQKIIIFTPLYSVIKVLNDTNFDLFSYSVLLIYFLITFILALYLFNWD